jgi:hypothetical protein
MTPVQKVRVDLAAHFALMWVDGAGNATHLLGTPDGSQILVDE